MLNWPALPLNSWRDTCDTLHLWTQIVGKIRMKLSPELNHWWHTTLYVNSRGLTTSSIPYGTETFEIQFDFIGHRLEIATSVGDREAFPLVPESVAAFHERLMTALRVLGITVSINTKPQEVANPIPFDQDDRHSSYDREYAHRFWRVLLSTSVVFNEFRSRFIGKCSPVHLFWGSFDLACSRFSGGICPPRKGVISGPAYSHEVISAGFWPGGGVVDDAAFYSYTVPQPAGLPEERVRPAAASWNKDLSEFILMYEDVRHADSPGTALLEFLQSTYDAGARLANWDRHALECDLSARTA